ncbi:uncharacterized protein EI97DRAFT_436528 [Westerdykella ornata]|uniref:Uncharacterized protein n=1 Tax=Westerdykella ornata TaxID=318751 RepID=A0A6A6J9M9_WESOR|nr:uncharacterized protein EI97DRAFT_436528 [Westerdykella ornata]KAF2272924.1 hypothetical protein EI97DRAFT_436528 [Westerdykella ornata]
MWGGWPRPSFTATCPLSSSRYPLQTIEYLPSRSLLRGKEAHKACAELRLVATGGTLQHSSHTTAHSSPCQHHHHEQPAPPCQASPEPSLSSSFPSFVREKRLGSSSDLSLSQASGGSLICKARNNAGPLTSMAQRASVTVQGVCPGPGTWLWALRLRVVKLLINIGGAWMIYLEWDTSLRTAVLCKLHSYLRS